ncbi:hypothetical protein HDU86_008395 [Geranomyces michiganensis]|nr:hypothetical protein HDU86_008395 [Geranomyces michiganensis]
MTAASALPDDPFACLPAEIAIRILQLLVDHKTLAQLPCVNKRWQLLANDPQVWRSRVVSPSKVLTNASRDGREERRVLDRLSPAPIHFAETVDICQDAAGHASVEAAVDKARHFCTQFMECVDSPQKLFYELGDLAAELDDGRIEVIASGFAASSEDDADVQSIAACLDPSPRSFWSSKPSPSATTSEWLTFSLAHTISVVHSVRIRPYKATYQRGMPIYAPRMMQIAIGMTPDPEQMHFWSRIYVVANIDADQEIIIAPQLVAGSFLHLRLIGRYQTQPGDEMFYTVLGRVQCFGLPLGFVTTRQPTVATSLMRFCDAVQDSASNDIHGNHEYDDEPFDETPQEREERLSLILNRLSEHVEPLREAQELATATRSAARALVAAGNWHGAAKLVARAPVESPVRSAREVAWLLREAPASPPIDSPTRCGYYLTEIATKTGSAFNPHEAMYFAHAIEGQVPPPPMPPVLGESTAALLDLPAIVRAMVGEGRVECTEQLGDSFLSAAVAARGPGGPGFLFTFRTANSDGTALPSGSWRREDFANLTLALLVYTRANAFHKMVDCFLELGEYSTAIQIAALGLPNDDGGANGGGGQQQQASGEEGVVCEEFVELLRKVRNRRGKAGAAEMATLLLEARNGMRRTVEHALGIANQCAAVSDAALAAWLRTWATVPDDGV